QTCALPISRDGWNDFDSVTVREPAVPRMIQQHLVVHGKVEHGVVELLAETGNPAIEHVDERRDRRHGLIDGEGIGCADAKRGGKADENHGPSIASSSLLHSDTGTPFGSRLEIS